MNWQRQHKWSGIVVVFFMLVFCISGIILNHRSLFGGIDVSRRCLPPFYAYENWNSGLMRGTLSHGNDILVYGTGGIWLCDSLGNLKCDFNKGLSESADSLQIRTLASNAKGSLYALTPYGIYTMPPRATSWHELTKCPDDERYTDMVLKGDTLVLMGRSHLYVKFPVGNFKTIALKAPSDKDISRTTAFRTVWMLHSGALFGMAGRIFVDLIAVIIILLCITGLIIFIYPGWIKLFKTKRGNVCHKASQLKTQIHLHNRIGRLTIFFTVAIVFTGWMLRPPFLIGLAQWKVAPVSGTTLHSTNPWNDKLRMIRYDDATGQWLISTSEGFFALDSLTAIPHRVVGAPPVSVMGLNVWEPMPDGKWLCGSFSGLYKWDRIEDKSRDFFTGELADDKPGPPFGKKAVAGYSPHIGCVVLYDEGTDRLPQPDELRFLPMSLWNAALEAHSGRIYFGPAATYFFIFLIAAIALWCLISGYMMKRK